MSAATARNETVETVVNYKYNSKVIAHIARSGDTNALAQQKKGAVAGIQGPESEGDGIKSLQWSVISTVMLWNWIR